MGTDHLPSTTTAREKVRAPLALVPPLSLVYPLLASPFLFPEKAWHILAMRVQDLGM